MTNTLKTEKSASSGTSLTRTRALLVALLGFGAADVLVLNLWAVPKLVTTTDVRAAQSGDQRVAASSAGQPQLAAAEAPARPRPSEAQPALQQEVAKGQPEQAAPEQPPVDDSEAVAEAAALAEAEAQRAAAPSPGAVRALTATQLALPQRQAAPAETQRADPEPAAPRAEGPPLARVFFSLGNFAVGPNGRAALEKSLGQLTANDAPILVVGSADPSGTEQVNEKLSDARAQSVADWLLSHGIDAARIRARGVGDSGAAGNALDRRVDIWLGGSR